MRQGRLVEYALVVRIMGAAGSELDRLVSGKCMAYQIWNISTLKNTEIRARVNNRFDPEGRRLVGSMAQCI